MKESLSCSPICVQAGESVLEYQLSLKAFSQWSALFLPKLMIGVQVPFSWPFFAPGVYICCLKELTRGYWVRDFYSPCCCFFFFKKRTVKDKKGNACGCFLQKQQPLGTDPVHTSPALRRWGFGDTGEKGGPWCKTPEKVSGITGCPVEKLKPSAGQNFQE